MTTSTAIALPAATTAPPGNRQRVIEMLAGCGFALPAFVLLLLTNVVPLLVLLYLSFTNYELGALDLHFVGSDNFRKALADPVLRRSLTNTFVYVAIVLPGAVGLGLLIAVLRASPPPHALVLRGDLFPARYLDADRDGDGMAVPAAPEARSHQRRAACARVRRVPFLSEPKLVLPTLAAIGIWQLVGFNMVLFLAGLSAIPRDLYEAAEIDGCRSGIDRFLTITWPLLGPTTMFVIVTTSITAFKVFDTVAVMTRGGPMGASRCCSTRSTSRATSTSTWVTLRR
jgi:multiple sugar transport system permease protein